MPTVRSVVRASGTLIAVLLVAAGPVLAVPAERASAAPETGQRSSGTAAANSRSLAISITGMTPRTANQNSTITLRGTLANHTGSAVSKITVKVFTSISPFSTRSGMASFAATGFLSSSVLPATDQLPGSVPNGATVHWSASYPAGAVYNSSTVAVYPIKVEASSPAVASQATVQTLLPYWPGKTGAIPLDVAWLWPLVDTPQQGACAGTLATTELSGSVASGGRLATLLDAGTAWTQADHLTWNIDPALLSDVSVMRGGHFTGGSAACSGRFAAKGSPAAASWLAKLKSTTAGQPAFLTSYANVDVAALSHAGLDANIRSAYQVGKTVAGQILPNTFGTTGEGTGDGTVLRAAWPADGIADRGVLTSLASDAGIRTLVLASGEARSATGNFDNALSRTTSDIGTRVSLLLADSQLTALLGAAQPSPTASGKFALTQNFLAQTAMISSEAPNLARALVVAPPPDWDPSSGEASALLKATHDAPWLRAVDLSKLDREASSVRSVQLKAKQVSKAELSDFHLDQVRVAGNGASLFKDLLFQPTADLTNRLAAAVASTASSAWRGAGAAAGAQVTANLSRYLADSEDKVKLIANKKILLGGTTGETPVSVLNGLDWPVRVRVVAASPAGSQLQAGPLPDPFTVQPHLTHTVHLPLHSSTIGTTTVQLQLVTENGSPLTRTAQSLSVEVTRFGRSLLIIIGAALGILVLTSAYRLQRKRRAGGGRGGSPDKTANAGGAG